MIRHALRGLAFGLALVAGGGFAHAVNCSQTVGQTAAAVPFPTSGGGPATPQTYFEICNAHASQNLGVNIVGGTAAIGSAGTLTLYPGGCWWRYQKELPAAVSVIGSAASTTTACSYK